MLPELEPVARDWRRITDYLLALTEAVLEEQWFEPSGYPAWSNKDLLIHLAEGYVVRIQNLEAAVAGHEPPTRGSIDDVNAEVLARSRALTTAQIATRLRSNRDRVFELMDQLQPDQLDTSIERSGPPPYRQALRGFLLEDIHTHDLEHAADRKRSTGVTLAEPELGG